MKEKIEAKINEVIEAIIAKDPKDITYNEYKILDNKLATIKWSEEQSKHNAEYSEILGKMFANSVSVPPARLSDAEKE